MLPLAPVPLVEAGPLQAARAAEMAAAAPAVPLKRKKSRRLTASLDTGALTVPPMGICRTTDGAEGRGVAVGRSEFDWSV
ncbi:hypothetical protein Raf01_27120 [Rugosimonospora africana]|uniref:Uncharacterized protein n=1 Tax=Rugosimonospora africana TaxID=556532 RepID=A0A8J3QRW4_9ACTN|nr:hypothetical protein Raf01_27120 [Rugosimonospora africana]